MKKTQDKIDKWVESFGGYWKPLSILARLQEELGEVARALNIRYGEKRIKVGEENPKLDEEIVDLVITSLILANFFGINLEDSIDKKLGIYSQREKEMNIRENKV